MSFFSLAGQTALVTGASRGIGAAIAQRLAEAGARVLVNYRSNPEAAETLVARLREHSPESVAVGFDICDQPGMEKALAPYLETLSVVVANAGISKEALVPRANQDHYEEIFRTNFFATTQLVRLTSRAMMRERRGSYIFLSSIIGEMGNKGQSAYAASKSALFGYCKSLALEMASRSITANIVCPGFIETEMTGRLDVALQEAYRERIPLGRFGKPEEIAALVHYLASNEARYTTGAIFDVNGGLRMS